MSGPNETRDSADETGTDPGPASVAPPSFGNADPAKDEPVNDEPTAPSAQTSTETSEEAPADKPDTAGLPTFMLQRPWWATDEDDEPAPEPQRAEQKPQPEPAAAPEPGEAAPEPATVEAEEAEPSGDAVGTGPLPAPTPGTLVAGVGVPRVDSRGAVPAQPLVPPSTPPAADTDPDGIPAIRIDDDAPTVDKPADAPKTAEQPEKAEETSAPVPAPDADDTPADDDTAPIPRTVVPIPAYDLPEQAPLTAPAAPTAAPTAGDGSRGRRKGLLVAGGVAGAIIVAAGAFALVGANSGDDRKAAPAARTPTSAPQPTASQPAPPPPASPLPPQASVNNAKTDPKPFALAEAFPTNAVTLGGRPYVRDRASVNHNCALAARGAMAQALQRERCTSVVRVTFLDKERSVAVTVGVAVLPDRDAALRAVRAGDPSRYEWFRGMAGSRTKDIDRAGGYAASTVRGRYIVYSYAQYANGKRPQPGDSLQAVAGQFIQYGVRPIDARAKQRP